MNETRNNGTSILSAIGHALCALFRICLENYLVVSHEGREKFRMPVLAFVILFLIFHGALIVAMIVSLFFGVRYGFAKKDDIRY
jgi:hypothetical protein